jgi:hypothetical protein
MWMMAASIGLSALQGGQEAKAKNESIERQNAQTTRNFIAGAERNQAVNKTIAEANLQNTIRTGYRAGILNVQRGQAKVAAVRAGYDIGAKGIQALSTSAVDAAASGSIGASVAAVSENIKLKMDMAQGDVDSSWEVQQQNFDQSLGELVQQGQDTLRSAEFLDYTPPELGRTTSVGNAMLLGAVKSAVGFGTQYAEANMRLGLGGASSSPSFMSTNNTGNSLRSIGAN